MADTSKLGILIEEARTFGIEVLPPDVNESQVVFAPARGGTVIRFGLAAIKGVGEVAVESILKARAAGDRFSSLADLCERVDGRTVNRKVLEALIKSGACDCLGENRATLFAQIDRVLSRAASINADRQRGQNTLFDLLEEPAAAAPAHMERLEEWPQHEMLAAEKELLGFYVTGHPLTPYAQVLAKFCLTDAVGAAKLPNRTLTRVGGLITAVQSGVSKKTNRPYALATLEDLSGTMSLLCLNENYEKYRELLVLNQPVLVVGEINNAEDKPKIFPQEIMPLDDAPRKYTRQVHLRLQSSQVTPEKLLAVRQRLSAYSGRCPLFLCLIRGTGEVVFIETNERYFVAPSKELQREVDELFGEETYYAKVDTSLPARSPRRWEEGSNL